MADTASRGYPKPVASHNVADDLPLIQQALDLIDADVAAALLAIAGKAAAVHGHSISDVTGLTSALSGKAATDHTHSLEALSDVSGTDAAPDNYVLTKVGGVWVPASRTSIMTGHEHSIADVTGLGDALLALLSPSDIATLAGKGAPALADGWLLVDSEDSSALKLVAHSSLRSALKTYFDTLYAGVAFGVPSGTMMEYGGASEPSGWYFADGSVKSQTTDAALYAAIGSAFNTGGEGGGNFRLPDRRGRVGIGKGDMGGTGANRLGASLTGTRASTSSGVITGLSSTASLAVGMLAFGTGIGAGAAIASIDSGTQVTLSVNSSATGSGTIRFAVVDDQTLGASGGAAAHKLTTGQMPAHTHNAGANIGGRNTSTGGGETIVYDGSTRATTSTGGDQAHPNVQPGLVVNIIIKR